MRRILLSIMLTIAFFTTINAQIPYVTLQTLQFGSQKINVKDGILYACSTTKPINLSATFLAGTPSMYAKNTKAYTGVSIPFNSQPWYNSANATGSPVSSPFSTEDDTNRVLMPFKFCFWGSNYAAGSTLILNSNGFVTFNQVAANQFGQQSQQLPATAPALSNALATTLPPFSIPSPFVNLWNNAIYGAWHDLDPTTTTGNPASNITYRTIGVAPYRMFVINYDQIRMYNGTPVICAAAGNTSFQIILYETSNVVEIYIKEKPSCATAADGGKAVSGIIGKVGDGVGIPLPGKDNSVWSVSSVASIAYRFIPSSTSTVGGTAFVSWYDKTGGNALLGVADSITVVPPALPRTYASVLCTVSCFGDSTFIQDTVIIKQSNLTATIISNNSTTNVSCFGGNDGKIIINNQSGADSVLYYTWLPYPAGSTYEIKSGNNIGDTIKGLNVGTYTILVFTGKAGADTCLKTFTAIVGQPAVLQILTSNVPPWQVGCNIDTISKNILFQGGNGGAIVTSVNSPYPYPYLSSTGNTLIGIDTGTYTVCGADSKGCTTCKTFTAITPPKVNITVNSITNISCTNLTGSITVGKTGGNISPVAPGDTAFRYSIAPPFPGSNLPTLSPTATGTLTTATWSTIPKGTFTISVRDRNNCISDTIITIDSSSGPAFGLPTITNVACNPMPSPLSVNGGCITISAASYTANSFAFDYIYSLAGPVTVAAGAATTAPFNKCGLSVGAYIITAKDNKNCTNTFAFNITQPAPIVKTLSIVDVICFGDTSGKAKLTINSGGNPLFTYAIYPTRPKSTNDTFINLKAGVTYTLVTTYNSGGCTDTTLVNVSNINPPFLLNSIAVSPKCFGDSGCIKVNVTGGVGIGVNAIAGHGSAAIGDTICGLNPGAIYTVSGSDNAGCLATQTITIPITTAVAFTTIKTNVTCAYSSNTALLNNGTITVTASGGSGSYTYSSNNCGTFDGNNIIDSLVGSTAGVAYQVCVKDNKGCTSTPQIVTIFNPAPITYTPVLDSVKCYGSNDGKITFTSVINGTGAYSFGINGLAGAFQTVPPATGNVFSNLLAGLYTLVVKDNIGCNSNPFPISIYQPDSVIVNATISTPILCFGNLATITANASGGNGSAYQYKIDTNLYPAASNVFTGVTVGIHTIYARAVNGNCEDTIRIDVKEPALLVGAVLSVDSLPGCGVFVNNGIIKVKGTGGTRFSTGGYKWQISPSTTPIAINPASPATDSIARISGLAASVIYTITIIDSNNCTKTFTYTAPAPILPTLSVAVPTAVCSPSTVDVTSLVTTNATATTYYTTLTNAINATSPIIATAISVNDTIYIRAEAANACFRIDSAKVIIKPLPVVNAVPNQTICALDSSTLITLTGNNVAGVVYNWAYSGTNIGTVGLSGTGSVPKFLASNAGNTPITATFTVTPVANGCTGATVTFTIVVNPKPTLTPTPDQIICSPMATTAVNFSALAVPGTVAGVVYTWTQTNTGIGLAGATGTGNIPSFTTINTGNTILYDTIVVTATANSCASVKDTFVLTIKPLPIVNAVPNQTICALDSSALITLAGNGIAGVVYSWAYTGTNIGTVGLSGTGSVPKFLASNTGNTPITATFTVTPVANGCTGATVTFTIIVNPKPTITPIPDQVICAGDNAVAASFTGNNIAGVVYTATQSNASIGATITPIGVPTFVAINTGNTIVYDTVIVTATANGCVSVKDTFIYTVKPKPVINPIASQTICALDSSALITITGNGIAGVVYSWAYTGTNIGTVGLSGTGSVPKFLATNITNAPITATFTVTPVANGCTGATVTFTIIVNPKPTITPIPDQVICAGDNAVAASFTGNNIAGVVYTATQSNASIGATITPTGVPIFVAINSGSTIVYDTVIVTATANGCASVADTFVYRINPKPAPSISGNLFVCDDTTTTLTGIPGVVPPATAAFVSWFSSNTAVATISSTGVVTGLTAGTTTISYVVVNGYGCTDTAKAIFTVYPRPIAIASNPINPGCAAAANAGSFVITGSNGTPFGAGYTWILSPNTAPKTLSTNGPSLTTNALNLNTGTYIVTITDSKGCTNTVSQILSNSLSPTATLDSINNVICPGDSNGCITFTIHKGAKVVTVDSIKFTPNVASAIITLVDSTAKICGLFANTYTIKITDSNQCSYSLTALVDSPIAMNLTLTADSVKCFGDSTGSISASTTNGNTGGYVYKIDGPISRAYAAVNPFTGLPIGIYTVTVKDSKGCEKTKSITIYQPTKLSVTASAPAIRCKGGDTTITIVGTGGILGYLFNVNAGAYGTIAAIGSKTAGLYTIGIKDANNCIATDTVNIIEPTDSLKLALSNFINPGCGANANGGQFQATATGGNNGYIYGTITAPGLISATTGAATNMTVGAYVVNVTDAKLCTAIASYTFAPVGLPTISLDSIENVTCPGNSDGCITFTIHKGVRIPTLAQISYSPTVAGAIITLVDSTAKICGLLANSYTINLTDSNQCIATLTGLVDSPIAMNLTLTADSVKCFGDSTGSISASTTNGNTGGYVYKIDGPISRPYAAVNPFTGLPIGTYIVTVKDSKGCEKTKSITIYQPTKLSVTASAPAIRCKGGDTTITIVGSGGIATYLYNINGGVYGSIIPDQLAGIYTIGIKDANNCIAADTVNIIEPAAIVTLALSNFVNPGCGANANSGTMTALAAGGNSGFTYASIGLSNTPATSGAFTNASAATFIVTATDSKGCTSTASHTFITPNAPTDTIVVTNATCNGVCDGTATASPNGFAPFTYAWTCPNTTSTTASVTGLCAGPCSVIITDSNGCNTTVNFTISQPAILTGLAVTHVNPSSSVVNNGTITGSGVTGGTAPYSYYLDSAGVTLAGPQSSPTFVGLHAGLYCINVTDSNHCDTLRVCDTLISPTVLNCVAIATSQDCFGSLVGSSIVVITSGSVPNYTYTTASTAVIPVISPGTDSATYSLIPAGTDTFKVKAANGDSAVCFVTVNPVTIISPTISFVNPGCLNNNGTITVAATGGTGIKNAELFQGVPSVSPIQNTTYTFINRASGTYQVVVTDTKGCKITNTITLAVPTPLAIDSASATAVSCVPGNDGCVKFKVLNATGVLSIVINGAAPIYQSATTYNVCTYTNGTYNIVVTDTASKCSVLTTIIVPVSPKPTISITGQTPTNCVLPCNGTATASATSGLVPYTYSSNATGVFAASNVLGSLCFGSNIIIVKDAKGCKDSISVSIINPNPPTLSVIAKTTPVCYGDSNATVSFTSNADTIKYSGVAGNGTLFAPIGSSITGLKPGVLLISAISANGCKHDTTITIDTIAKMVLTLGKTDPTCFGGINGIITKSLIGGTGTIVYSLVDSNGSIYAIPSSLTSLPAGCYTMTAIDVTSCSTTASICLTSPDSIAITVSAIVQPTCFGTCNGTANVAISGGTPGYTITVTAPATATAAPVYNTTGNATAISGLCKGTYTVSILDANNCIKTKTFQVTEPTKIIVDSFKVINPTCIGNDGKVTVFAHGGTGTITTTISGNTVNQGNMISGLNAGTLIVNLLDANNCPVDTTVILANPIQPNLTIASQTATSCAPINGTVTLNVANANGSYTILPATTGLAVGPHTFVVTDSLGCKDTVVATIVAKPNPTLTLGTIVKPLCVGDSNAVINYTSNGTVFINGTAVTSITNVGATSITGLEAGTFTLTAYNADSCTTTVTGSVAAAIPLTLSLTKLDVLINGQSTGTITASNGGGVSGYINSINQNGNPVAGVTQVGNVFSGLAIGIYTVVLTDASGCKIFQTIALTQPGQIIVKCDSVVKPTCFGGNDGMAYYSATNAVSPYTWSTTLAAPYVIGTSDSTYKRTNLTAGTYVIQAKDANGSLGTAQCVIIDTPQVKFDSVKFTNPTCNAAGGVNGANGTITVWMSGGTGSKTYTINGSATVHADASTTAGLSGTQCYTITALDSKGCSRTTIICLTNPTLPTLSVTSTTPESCIPAANGTAVLAVANSNGSYVIASTPAQTGLAVGNYIYTVTDSLGCKDTTLAIITKRPNPSLSAGIITKPNCNGDSNGVFNFNNPTGATISIVGGTAISAASAPVGNAITDLKAGTLTIKATSIYGCDSSITVTIGQPTAVVGTANIFTVTIADSNDGAITVLPSGGTAPYTYSIDSNGNAVAGAVLTGNVFSNLYAGCYNITIIDSHLCTYIFDTCVLEPGVIVLTIAATSSVTCYGGNNGSITINATGGVPFAGSKFNWLLTRPNSTTSSYSLVNPLVLSTLVAGTYTIKATDANGATKTTTFTIAQPIAPIVVTSIVLQKPLCVPANSGCITVGATGGTGVVKFIVYNAAGTIALDSAIVGTQKCGFAAGNYQIKVRDANGCDTTFTIILDTLVKPIITTTATTDEWCNPDSNGTITITATGGNGALTYGLTASGVGGTTNNVLQGLVAGNYVVYAVDTAKCAASANVTVLHKPNPSITGVDTTFALCNPAASATITVYAAGTSLKYKLDTGTPQTGNVFNNVAAGGHTITVIDSFGCTDNTIITIYTIASPTITFVSKTPEGCDPDSNGGFVLNTSAAGTTVSYTPLVTGASVTLSTGVVTATGLTAQNYTVTVTDLNTGCTTALLVSVLHTTPVAFVSSTFIPNLCFGDSTGQLTYTSTFPAVFFSAGNGTSVWSTISDTISGLPAGAYTLIITDSNGCKDTTVKTIAQPTQLVLSAPVVTPITCNTNCDGTFTTIGSGGIAGTLNYSINTTPVGNNTNALFTALCPGLYTVTVINANGCSASKTDSIKNVSPIVFVIDSTVNVKCNGDNTGKICLHATGSNGGFSYSISPNPAGAISGGCFSNLPANTYIITATDTKGCTSTTSVIITQPTLVVINLDSIKNVRCFGEANGYIKVSGTGGVAPYTYSFGNNTSYGTNNIWSTLTDSTYTIYVKDANGCEKSQTYVITQPAVLSLAALTYTNVLCNGGHDGTITPNTTGGTLAYTTTIVGSSIPGGFPLPVGIPSFTGLYPDTFTITVVDANGCVTSTTRIITEPAPLMPLTFVTNVSCFGGNNGSICIKPTGGTPQFVYSIIKSTTVPPVAVYGQDSCKLNLFAGTYYLALKDSNGCTSRDTVDVLQPPTPLVIAPPIITQNIKCYGDSTGTIIVNAAGGTPVMGGGKYNYAISGSVSELTTSVTSDSARTCLFTNLKAGSFIITVTDANGCVTTTNIILTQNNKIVITKFSYKQPRCFDESNGEVHLIAKDGEAPLTYSLLPTYPAFQPKGDFFGLKSIVYNAIVEDAFGCRIDTTFLLPQPAPLVFTLVDPTEISCVGTTNGTILADATGGNGIYRYLLTPGVQINTSGVFGGLSEGLYTLSVVDTLGCRTDSLVNIDLNATPLTLSSTSNNINNCFGFGYDGSVSTTPFGGTGPFTFVWNTTPPQTTPGVTGLPAGLYVVNVTDADGCTSADTVRITAANCCEGVSMPTGFTPNNDGLNDVFKSPNAMALDIQLLNFSVYDRWGNKVFDQQVDKSVGWDGTYKNIPADLDVYQYMYRYRCNIDNKIYMLRGDITLTR